MFGALTEKFQSLFARFSGQQKLREGHLVEVIEEVRLALLEADVQFTVAGDFVQRVKEKAIGMTLVKSVTAEQQFIKIVHDELVELMGGEPAQLALQGKPAVVMLCGLQGSGKTTQCAKLAAFYKKRTLIAACDLQRPAAVEQLRRLCAQIGASLFCIEGASDPLQVAKGALAHAQREGYDLLIVDTAGRLHLDDALMRELEQLKALLHPQEVLFVASAATGQDAVRVAREFDERVGITGTILTMLDGSARAGAAISIRAVTNKPLKFEGIGEKVGDLQPFNPRSMADRILGMGDIINLVRKAQEEIAEEERKTLEEKFIRSTFTFADLLHLMAMIKRMGSLQGIMKMIPGIAEMAGDADAAERESAYHEAAILSMTPEERQCRVELLPGRRRRIAMGSGTSMEVVNRLLKHFKMAKQRMKDMPALQKQFKKYTSSSALVGNGTQEEREGWQ